MSKISANNIRLLLIDDHALFRESVARLLQAEPGFEVVADCSSGSEGMRIINSREIDIVLLDIDLGQERGADFLESLRAEHFKGKILLVTAGVNDSEVPDLIRKGVSGIFLKHGSPALLIQGIRETMEGKDPIRTGFATEGIRKRRGARPASASRSTHRAGEPSAFVYL